MLENCGDLLNNGNSWCDYENNSAECGTSFFDGIVLDLSVSPHQLLGGFVPVATRAENPLLCLVKMIVFVA